MAAQEIIKQVPESFQSHSLLSGNENHIDLSDASLIIKEEQDFEFNESRMSDNKSKTNARHLTDSSQESSPKKNRSEKRKRQKSGDNAPTDSLIEKILSVSAKPLKTVQICAKGGCKYLECDYNYVQNMFEIFYEKTSKRQRKLEDWIDKFYEEAFSEENGHPIYVMGIFRNAAKDLPCMLRYLEENHPDMKVAVGSLTQARDGFTTSVKSYASQFRQGYDPDSGTSDSVGPMREVSCTGVRHEERGLLMNKLLGMLESHAVLKNVMPWSKISNGTTTKESCDDGPILWIRPGEQSLDAQHKHSEWRGQEQPAVQKEPRIVRSLRKSTSVRTNVRRIEYQDRTKPHADYAGGGSSILPTAAVGVLKAVQATETCEMNQIKHIDTSSSKEIKKFFCKQFETADGKRKVPVKEVIAFDSRSQGDLASLLEIDYFNKPTEQCKNWVQWAELNKLRRDGIKYANIELYDNDIYVIPRGVVHQFHTITSAASIAWHIRLKKYYEGNALSVAFPFMNDVVCDAPNSFEGSSEIPNIKKVLKRKNSVKKERTLEASSKLKEPKEKLNINNCAAHTTDNNAIELKKVKKPKRDADEKRTERMEGNVKVNADKHPKIKKKKKFKLSFFTENAFSNENIKYIHKKTSCHVLQKIESGARQTPPDQGVPSLPNS